MQEIIIKAEQLSTSNYRGLEGKESKVQRKRAYITPEKETDLITLAEAGLTVYTPEKDPNGKPFIIVPFSATTTVVNDQTKKVSKMVFSDDLNANFGFKGIDICITKVDTDPTQTFFRVTALRILADTPEVEKFESNPFGIDYAEYSSISAPDLKLVESEPNFQ